MKFLKEKNVRININLFVILSIPLLFITLVECLQRSNVQYTDEVINSTTQEIAINSSENNDDIVIPDVEEIKKNVITHVTLTCYQPVEAQCDSDPLITADGSEICLDKLKQGSIKWCAISRDLLWLFPKNKPKMVHIEGYGVYEVRDVMNKRYNHRMDLLIHPDDNTLIFKKNVKVTILS